MGSGWKTLVLTVAGFSLAASSCAGDTSASGLKYHTGGAMVASTLWYDQGQRFSEGTVQLFPYGPEPVEIVEIRSNHIEGDLEYLGAYIAGPYRDGNIQGAGNFPPDEVEGLGKMERAEGAQLAPLPSDMSEAGYELILGYKAGSALRSVRESVDVDYRVEGQPVQTQTYNFSLAVCPKSVKDCKSYLDDADLE